MTVKQYTTNEDETDSQDSKPRYDMQLKQI